MAKNYFAGKYMDGTFAHGEGPVSGLNQSSERENPGLLNPSTDGRYPREVGGGPTTITPPTGNDGLFSLRGKSYAGPQNWIPTNDGVSNPFDIN